MKRAIATLVVFGVALAAGYAGAQSKQLLAEMIQGDLLAFQGMKETRPTLDPRRYSGKAPIVSEAYQVAKEIPGVLDKLFCYCYCETNPKFKHKNLLTCYTDDHASVCGVCIKEAVIAKAMTEEGKTPEQIAKTFADYYLKRQQ